MFWSLKPDTSSSQHVKKTTTTDPQAKSTAPTYANLIEATAGASNILMLQHDPTAMVLNLQVNPERMDRLIFHPEATPLVMDGETYNNAFHWIPSAKKPE